MSSFSTPISLEHTDVLGGTIPEIARRRPASSPTVASSSPRRSANPRSMSSRLWRRTRRSDDRGREGVPDSRTSATAEGQKFRLKTARASYEATLPLAGQHQLENAATAIVACEELCERQASS